MHPNGGGIYLRQGNVELQYNFDENLVKIGQTIS